MAPRRFSLTIDSDQADIRDARSFARDVGGRTFPEMDLAALLLLVSEVVGNAVALDAGPVTLTLRPVADTRLRVEVRDDGWGMPEPDHRRLFTGNGLRILGQLAEEWGVDQFLPGKIVWFTLPGRLDGRR